MASGAQYADLKQAKTKQISYAESESEGTDNDDVFKPSPKAKSKNARPTKRRRVSESADEDTYEAEDVAEEGEIIHFVLYGD